MTEVTQVKPRLAGCKDRLLTTAGDSPQSHREPQMSGRGMHDSCNPSWSRGPLEFTFQGGPIALASPRAILGTPSLLLPWAFAQAASFAWNTAFVNGPLVDPRSPRDMIKSTLVYDCLLHKALQQVIDHSHLSFPPTGLSPPYRS